MRIALAVEGTRGDVHPMLGLGGRLREQGHDVRLCAPPDFRETADALGFEFHAVGASVRAYLAAHADAITAGGRRILRESSRYLRETLNAQFETLPDATRGADCVFAAGVQLGARSAAELHGIPYRYVAYCPGLFPSREHAPVILPTQSLPRWANRFAWRGTLLLYDGMLRRMINRLRRRAGLARIRSAIPHLLGERPWLAADPELAPPPADSSLGIRSVRCLHPHEEGSLPALPPKLDAFLDQGPPPVYLGFGSMTDPDPGRTTRALLEAIRALGCRALIGEGWAGLGSGPLPEGVLAIGPVAHPRLFPRLAAVVHHGGAGTTHTAARAGVPQIIVPHVFDQFYWGRRVQELGLGPPPIRRTRLDASRLGEALGVTLENELLAERAREFGALLTARAREEAAAGDGLEILS